MATRFLIARTVVPAHRALDNSPTYPAPIALALLASHVVAAAVLLCLKGTMRALLHPKAGCIQSCLPHQPRSVLLASAIQLVSPRVIVAKVCATRLAVHFCQWSPVFCHVWPYEHLALRTLAQSGVRLLLFEASVLCQRCRLVTEDLFQLPNTRHSYLLQVPIATTKSHTNGADHLLHAAVLDTTLEVELCARSADAVALVAACLQHHSFTYAGVLEADRTEEGGHRLEQTGDASRQLGLAAR
mmetsp:Transcript_36161/g.84123  ORF Transcript_36161/g.84123 Transcript_36161/m.84123 type:complete len:243 (-) Transcript_36161:541-1269(-)